MVRIFLISDRENVIKQFGELCKENSYEFHTCSDIKIIEEILEAETFDIILLDNESGSLALNLSKQLKNTAGGILLLTGKNDIPKELLKSINAILPEDFSKELVLAALNINLRMKGSLQKLANTNKDLAASLYRQNTLYNISSQFAGTLDKAQLLEFMIEGLDKALSFSLTCTLSFCTEEKPVLILNSLYEISEELLNAIKLRTILNYRALFDGKQAPYEIDENTLKVIKHVKYPASRFNFTLFQFDNMFAPIALGENFYGCVEIFKEAHFTAEDAKCFQTIAQQVSLPLKNATLYQEIIETNKKLERLEKLKSEFISIVSHELRTPLTSIKNSLDILLSGKCGEVTQAGEKFLTMAKRNVTRLSGIINDLLDISKIEAGKMDFHFKPVQLNMVIDYVKSALSGLAKEKSLEVSVEEFGILPEVTADAQRLEQVLTNLLSNAIKFTPEGKQIRIKSELLNAEDLKYPPCFEDAMKNLKGNYIVVSVEDEGIGIAENELLHAFDKFAQIENSLSRKVGGSGLGLPIAKQLIEAHKGAIWCESVLNKGSKFYFALPVELSQVEREKTLSIN
ncbi:hybrid sensor histidine kinase/response regulator [bacterium]|nr:hybrid sensor histidine kinase/response regulator [bacterium]